MRIHDLLTLMQHFNLLLNALSNFFQAQFDRRASLRKLALVNLHRLYQVQNALARDIQRIDDGHTCGNPNSKQNIDRIADKFLLKPAHLQMPGFVIFAACSESFTLCSYGPRLAN